jgi:tape measure domain-containing protein
MTQVGSGEVAIFPTFKGFRSETVREVDSTASEAGGKFSSAFGSAIKGIGVGVAAAVGASIGAIGAIAGKGLGRALNIQDAEKQLEGLGHSAESVNAIMTNALASVKGTAFGLDSAATVAASSVAAGIKPGADLERTLKNVADAATIAKTDMGSMGGIFNKVASSNKVQGDVIAQLSDQGIPILQLLSAQLGVTTDDVLTMSKRGQIDFATFQAAMEKGLGGSAQKSGETARGAFKNIGAAFSRMGALFVGSAVDGAPSLFTSIAGAVDRATTALTPLAAKFSGVLAPAMASLGAYIDTIDFGRILGGVQGIYDLVVKGDFTTGFREAFSVEEDSGIVDFILTIRDGISGIYDFVVNGDFTGAFSRAFNVQEDSPIVDTLFNIREAVVGFFGEVGTAFQTGDFSGIFDSFGKIGATIQPLFPIFVAVAGGLGGIAGSVGELIAAGFPLLVPILEALTGAFTFLGDHPTILAAALIGLAAAFLVAKVATAVNNAQIAASIPLRYAELASAFATRRALAANTAARIAESGAQTAATAATNGGILANLRAAASTVAARVAMVAGAVATGVATAAQWALNAAMSANPIGIVVLAIAALVAGLIWFFTQTELGQDIWANFTRFLGEAWANIVAVATAVFTGLGSFFSDTWNNIVSFITTAVAVLVDLFLTWTPLGIIISNFGGIVQFFVDLWNNVTGAVSTGIDAVVKFFTDLPGKAMAALGNLGSLLIGSGGDLIQGFIDGITGAIDKVGDAIGGVMDFVGGFFPHSPAKRGPFSGSGWTAIGKSGAAIIDEFNAGFPDEALRLGGTFAANISTGRSGGGAGDASSPAPVEQFNQTINALDGQSAAEIAEIARNERLQAKRKS